jgi:hypothetical protein
MQGSSRSKSLLISALLFIFVISFTIPFHSFASGPTVLNNTRSYCSGGCVSLVLNLTIGNIGDTIIVGAGALAAAGCPILGIVSSAGSLTAAQDGCNVAGPTTLNVEAGYFTATLAGAQTITISGNNFMAAAAIDVSGVNASTALSCEGLGTLACTSGISNQGFSAAFADTGQGSSGNAWTATAGYSLLSASNFFGYNLEYNVTNGAATPTFPMSMVNAVGPTILVGMSFKSSVAGFTTITSFSTVTGWNVLGSQTSFNWFLLAIMLMLFPTIVWTMMKMFHAGPDTIVFPTLVAVFLGCVMGTIGGYNSSAGIVPMAITFYFGAIMVLFVIKSRTRGNSVMG